MIHRIKLSYGCHELGTKVQNFEFSDSCALFPIIFRVHQDPQSRIFYLWMSKDPQFSFFASYICLEIHMRSFFTEIRNTINKIFLSFIFLNHILAISITIVLITSIFLRVHILISSFDQYYESQHLLFSRDCNGTLQVTSLDSTLFILCSIKMFANNYPSLRKKSETFRITAFRRIP